VSPDLEAELRDLFRDAGVRGWVHATLVTADSPRQRQREVGLGAREPVVPASVYKLAVLAAFCRAVDAAELDPTEQVTLHPADRTAGPTGLSVLADPVTMSWRDLATSMITVSDNAAADAVHRRVGQHRVRALLDELGLTTTRINGGTAETHRDLLRDTHTRDIAEAFAVLADNNAPSSTHALDPVYGSVTTPADMTHLLAALWRGELASPDQTAFARRVLGAQVWPHRLRAGFPATVQVAGKTGTLASLRNEVGIVTYPDEHPVAVAVFTHAARADTLVPRADAAIAAAAHRAVTALRTPRLTPRS